MFYVEINNELITGKGEGEFKTNEQIEVSEEIYNELTNLPAEYVVENEEIISVEPLPIPEVSLTPTPAQQREQEYETNPLIEWEGESITVDQANFVYLQYSAEGSPKATEIKTLIIAAKESIRQMCPDEEGE